LRFGGCEEELLLTYDLNNDGLVDALDIGDWIAMPADFNDDAAANSTDLGLLIGGVEQFAVIQEELTAE
ncbi:MAG: hypothetical protein IBJ10_09930, partial [Phycisphaerales bacterium]|nr:hypothetical protein [Phycisphaerales bacterium]